MTSDLPRTDASDSALMRAVEAELRLGVEAGRASQALLDCWATLGDFADRDPGLLAGIIDSASEPQFPNSTGAFVNAEAVGVGVVGVRGQLLRATETFQAWVGDPAESVDCLELVRKAVAEGRAAGRVRTLRQGVLATLAIADTSGSPWPGLVALADVLPGETGVLLVVFAPSRSHALIARAADALRFSPLQRRIVLALLDEPSLMAAALALGIGRETAKDALEGALQKSGVRRSSQLIGRLINLSCHLTEMPSGHDDSAAAALGLSRAEASVAARIAGGATVEEAAAELGLQPGTVKSYRRSIFEKLGINRSRDLQRLMAEAGELERLSMVSELYPRAQTDDDFRIFNAEAGRIVAYLDYGPARGRPLLLMHGFWTGRLAPPPLLAALMAGGHRVIIPQRPGFGLTSPATGDYVATAASDMILILDRLGCPTASVLARDGGVATAMAFGAAHPDRLKVGVLQNPMRPRGVDRRVWSPISAVAAMMLRHPDLIESYARMLLREGRRDLVVGALRRAYSAVEADRACFEQPDVVDHLAVDMMGLGARTVRGAIDEQRLYSEGWQISVPYIGPRWRLAFSGRPYTPGEADVWRSVSAGAPVILLEAGLLAQFTHAEAIAALFAI